MYYAVKEDYLSPSQHLELYWIGLDWIGLGLRGFDPYMESSINGQKTHHGPWRSVKYLRIDCGSWKGAWKYMMNNNNNSNNNNTFGAFCRPSEMTLAWLFATCWNLCVHLLPNNTLMSYLSTSIRVWGVYPMGLAKYGISVIPRLTLDTDYLCTKFDESNLSRFRDTIGAQNLKWVTWPWPRPFGIICRP